MKYAVIISFCGAVDREVEADSEEQAIEITENRLRTGEEEITDKEFASAEIEDIYVS